MKVHVISIVFRLWFCCSDDLSSAFTYGHLNFFTKILSNKLYAYDNQAGKLERLPENLRSNFSLSGLSHLGGEYTSKYMSTDFIRERTIQFPGWIL